MSKRVKHYEIKQPVRGSFVGAHGRVAYDFEAGIVSEKDTDPEVLARLIANGAAIKAPQPVETETEESA